MPRLSQLLGFGLSLFTFISCGLPALATDAASPVAFPGPPPGLARSAEADGAYTLENAVLSATWKVTGGHLQFTQFTDKLMSRTYDQTGTELFRLAPTESPQNGYPAFDLPASAFHLGAAPKLTAIEADPRGVRVADRIGGIALVADFVSGSGVRARWRVELRNGSNYIRERIDLSSPEKTIPLRGVEMTDFTLPGARTIGTVPGCPVCADDVFLGVEMPGSENSISGTRVKIGFTCKLEISPAQGYSFNAVAGVAADNQMRRSFLCYIERERARPSQPFLHYNDWFDLGRNENAAALMSVVKAYHTEMEEKRGVPVLAYLADDGWDNTTQGFWAVDTRKFPGGLEALKTQMAPLGAKLAIWISPLGGYGERPQRTAAAQKQGIVPAGAQLDLSIPSYKQWFQDYCLHLMRDAGVVAFKWDKAGEGVSPHFMALLDIAHHLREANPAVFINVTVGTWPSPFWLTHIDCTWRNGTADVAWAGKGDNRERWLTFRDGNCYRRFVEQCPLYPLNSCMHHGIVEGTWTAAEVVAKAGPNLRNEARSYFANGASLQELYLTPSLMTPEAWDDVADAAKWAHANADVLIDSHWVGGDPLALQAYGYAAWSPRKGTLMIRNPDDKPQSIVLDAAKIFELPAGVPRHYALQSPFKDQRIQSVALEAGQQQSVTLNPFEVLVFDATPNSSQ